MRTSAITAILALTTLSSTLSANDDFSSLLADLSFGDAPSLNQPLAVVKQEPAAELKPVPTAMVMPEMVEPTPQTEPAPVESTQAPQVALQDPIATDPVPSDQIDLEAMFATQDVPSAQTEVPAQTVGHLFSGCSGQSCDNTCITCQQRTKPRLPSSTLHQYFRSNVCNTNVWDDYRQKCCYSHKHTMRECDCFTKNGSCLSKGCKSNGCASCDAGCDR